VGLDILLQTDSPVEQTVLGKSFVTHAKANKTKALFGGNNVSLCLPIYRED